MDGADNPTTLNDHACGAAEVLSMELRSIHCTRTDTATNRHTRLPVTAWLTQWLAPVQ